MTPSALGPPARPESGRGRPEGRYLRAGHGRPRRSRLPGPVAIIASIAVLAGLAACGAGRDALGTNAGPCFTALPVAKHAVHGRGSLAGVRLVNVATVTARTEPAMHELLGLLAVPPQHDVCLVAYTGSFTINQVELPLGAFPAGGVGRYAVVVVTAPKPKLLATFVLRQAPLNFTRAGVGF